MSERPAKGSKTLADRFLQDSRDTHRPVSVYLVSGFQLKGEVVEFDDETILFKHKDVHQLIMRLAVAGMYPVSNSRQDVDEWWRSYGPGTGER